MATYSSTANLATFANNPELMSDKTPNLKTFVDELQATTVTRTTQSFGAAQASFTLFLADGAYRITGVSAVFGTASSSGTLQVEVATGTQAVASGTNQLTGTVSLAGTANTVVSGTLIGSPTAIASGNRVNIILGGTLTSLANAVVTVTMVRI